MKFTTLMFFDPRAKTIENDSDSATFSTTPHRTPYFGKPLYEKIVQFSIFLIGVKTLDRMGQFLETPCHIIFPTETKS